MNRVVVLVSLLSLLGCTVGPDYVRPVPDQLVTAADYASTAYGNEAESENETVVEVELGPPPDAAWWQAVGDPTLVELIDEAVRHNLDLEAARARVRQARAARRAVAADKAPQIGGSASAERARAGVSTPEGAIASAGFAELTQNRYDTFLSASWELDVFGGVQHATEAADARLDLAIEGVNGVVLGLIAEVARNYIDLRGNQRRLALAEENVALQTETARRVADLHRVGLGSKLDADRAQAQLAGTRARLAPLRASIRATTHRLAVLTGQPPHALLDRLSSTAPLAEPPDWVEVGVPTDLVRRRPDLRVAERRLAASTAEIGVATANLYPRFFLSGAGGLTTTEASDVLDVVNRTWRLGPSISWPIFQGGRLRAGVLAAEAERDAGWAEFRQAVLVAIEEVETALVGYVEEERRRRSLTEAAAASAEAA
ncbi:MAG: efflux transporter outer membrane subunit, partial [Acidobacteriota bacterium]